MIAETPLDQNLADNTELRQLIDNAHKIFGLIVCLGCNRAFANKTDQDKNCPSCGEELAKDQLAAPNLTTGPTSTDTSPTPGDPQASRPDDRACSPQLFSKPES